MSIEHQRTEAIFEVIQELVAGGKTAFRPGDVADVFRDRNTPIPVWMLRAEFSTLEAQKRIACDAETGDWHLAEGQSLSSTG